MNHLQQVWMMFMERRLRTVEAARSNADAARRAARADADAGTVATVVSDSADSSAATTSSSSTTTISSTPTKKILEQKQRDDALQREFRLPDTERVQARCWGVMMCA
jgi:hypothetical protein